MLSPHLIDQHILHKDAYRIPFLLAVPKADDADGRLFGENETSAGGLSWRPNLSQFAREYLEQLGCGDPYTSREIARLLWLHVLAIGYSPLYLNENADAIRNDWPRVPLPSTREDLISSTAVGERLAALLDIQVKVDGIDTHPTAQYSSVAAITTIDGSPLTATDLAVNVGWGVGQVRKLKSGATTCAVMPGGGHFNQRPRTDAEFASLSDQQRDLLGDEVIDVFLNESAHWSGVPEAAWDFKIGGFQVLRKWLSYREERLIGGPLSLREAREFTSVVRRLTAISLLAPELDANYRRATGAGDQDPLWQISSS